jgi:hypothetical protein
MAADLVIDIPASSLEKVAKEPTSSSWKGANRQARSSQKHKAPETVLVSGALRWLRGLDLNQRPLGYEFLQNPVKWLTNKEGYEP